MIKKTLSLFLAALMIFSGSFVVSAETESIQDPGFPTVEIIPGIDNTNDLVGESYVNENTGEADNGYVKIIPLGGNLVKVHYYNGYYLLNDDDEPVLADLNSIYYKAANSVFLVTFSPLLALDETAIFELGVAPHPQQQDFRPAVSHITTFDMNFTPPAEIYGLISGMKMDEGGLIIPISFDFEVYMVDPDTDIETLVATAYSDPTTGVLKFSYVGDPTLYDNLELEPGDYKLYEVDLPDEYEFVNIVIVEGLNISEPQENGAPFTIVDDNTIISFNITNRIKDSLIRAFKFDANEEENTPFADLSFSFELWKGDALFAIGESGPDGSVLFYLEWDEFGDPIGEGLTDLDLLYGDYTIKEVDIPISHEFVKLMVHADDDEPILIDETTEYMFSAGDVDTFEFYFYNKIKTSEITGFKFNSASLIPEVPGFTDVSFNFLVKNEELETVAIGHSLMDGTGVIIFHLEWDEFGVPTDTGTTTLVLPYGLYTTEEVSKTGYQYMGYEKYEGEILVDSGIATSISFQAGTSPTFKFIFKNEKIIIYKDDTAYAFPGYITGSTLDGGKLLDVVKKSNNWGWYINDQEGTFDLIAGAGKNIVENGTKVGTVTIFIKPNGYYGYTLNLMPGASVVGSPHFGVYNSPSKIPNAPGQYTNNILAAQATVMVFHVSVHYPVE